MVNAEFIIMFLIKTFVNTFESDANAIASLSFMYLEFVVWSRISTVTDWAE